VDDAAVDEPGGQAAALHGVEASDLVTVSWCSWPRRRDLGNRPAVVALATVAFLLVAAVSQPAFAASEDPRVIAVHTTPESDVSIVLAAPAVPADSELGPDELSVLFAGMPVSPTVTPMASSHLSVALVIDTAVNTTAEALQAAKSGAAEFLLGLPGGARTMVIQAGGTPRIVAPLSSTRATALSAVSDLRTSGARSTTDGTLLAAQELAAAPAGPRAIILYAAGSDERGASVEQLTEAVSRAAAVLNVIQTGGNQSWSSVVDRAGALLRAETAEVVQSYRRLLDALDDQYVVAFKAPELPGRAHLTVDTGDVESSVEVQVPEAETAEDAAPQRNPRGSAESEFWPVVGVLSGLALIGFALFAVLLRFRHWTVVPAERLPDAAIEARTGTTSEPPAMATSPKEEVWPTPLDGPSPEIPTTAPAMGSPDRRSKRGLLTDAVQGRRSAHHMVNSASKQESRHGLVNDIQPPQHAPADKPARPPPSDDGPGGRRANVALRVATLLSGAGSRIAALAKPADGKRSTGEDSNATLVFTGSGDAVVKPSTHFAGPWAVKISGNSASRYFNVQALDSEDDLVITLHRYWGIRSLNWNGGECTGFKIRAHGPWRIELLPLPRVPSFRTSFEGEGDMVVRFTGHGSRAEITCNDVDRFFNVRARTPESTQSLVNTTEAYSGTHQISGETQYFEVQAIGPWTITVR
jgi:hypothetical protein